MANRRRLAKRWAVPGAIISGAGYLYGKYYRGQQTVAVPTPSGGRRSRVYRSKTRTFSAQVKKIIAGRAETKWVDGNYTGSVPIAGVSDIVHLTGID